MRTIFVAETVPSQNKGEAALMHGIVKSIQHYADEDIIFYLCSERQHLDQIEYGDSVRVLDNKGLVPLGDGSARKLILFSGNAAQHLLFLLFHTLLGRFSLILFRDDLWKAYHEAYAIIIGHDNAFSKFHIPLILFAKLMRKKTAVYGATIMPVVLNSNLVRKLGRYALNKVDLITTREGLTFKHLTDIGVNKPPLHCTADKAFILDPTTPEEASALFEKLGLDDLPKPIIGVMVVKGSTVFKAAFKDENYSPDEKYDRHVTEIANALDNIHKQIGGTFIFVPHCIGPGDNLDDRVCAVAVKDKMVNKDSAVLVNDELRVTELKGLMGNFDMVVSERTHGGINAATMKVPTLWITHPKDHRTYGIVTDTLELPQCLYNIEDLRSETLSEKIMEIWGSRDKIVATLTENIPKAQDKTMSNGRLFKQHIL